MTEEARQARIYYYMSLGFSEEHAKTKTVFDIEDEMRAQHSTRLGLQNNTGYDYDAHMERLSDNDIRKKRWKAGMSQEENRRLSNMSLTKKRS